MIIIFLSIVVVILLLFSLYLVIENYIEPSRIENINPEQESLEFGVSYLFKLGVRILSYIVMGILLGFYFIKRNKYILINLLLLVMTIFLIYFM